MSKDANSDVSVRFEIEVDSIEVDVWGWLKALFRERAVRPLAGAAEHAGARAYTGAASTVRNPHPEGRRP